jgi:hypothetical protein
VLVEQIVAHDERWPTAVLFMPGLGIEGGCDQITLAGDVCSHLPDLFSGGRSPIDLRGFVVGGDLSNELLQFDSTPNPTNGCHHKGPILYGDLNGVPDVDLHIR